MTCFSGAQKALWIPGIRGKRLDLFGMTETKTANYYNESLTPLHRFKAKTGRWRKWQSSVWLDLASYRTFRQQENINKTEQIDGFLDLLCLLQYFWFWLLPVEEYALMVNWTPKTPDLSPEHFWQIVSLWMCSLQIRSNHLTLSIKSLWTEMILGHKV